MDENIFKEVTAAGGLVINERGEFLLIRRNGVWDLPKGHQEPGEDITEAAVREVMEETGISTPELGKLICITDHTYIRDDIRYLKHTWWYEMKVHSEQNLTPQLEEGITQVEWVEKSHLDEILKETYNTIREVFRLETFSCK